MNNSGSGSTPSGGGATNRNRRGRGGGRGRPNPNGERGGRGRRGGGRGRENSSSRGRGRGDDTKERTTAGRRGGGSGDDTGRGGGNRGGGRGRRGGGRDYSSKDPPSSSLKKNGEKGAEVHTVNEEYRIRFTNVLMNFREDDQAPDHLEFPSTLTNTERKFLHTVAAQLGLKSKSYGKGTDRKIKVTKFTNTSTKDTTNNNNNPQLMSVANYNELPLLKIGKQGFDTLQTYFQKFPKTHTEQLESYETGSALVDAIRNPQQQPSDPTNNNNNNNTTIANALQQLGLLSIQEDAFQGGKKQHYRKKINYEQLKRQHALLQQHKQTLLLSSSASSKEYQTICHFRKQLPAFQHQQEIIKVIDNNIVTIISGETGCGKTTQIPQFILDHHPTCNIVVTQPRRISAISIAERVMEEQGIGFSSSSITNTNKDTFQKTVGYQVRLESCYDAANTQLLFVTPGILLRKLQNQQEGGIESVYTHIVIDEIHERDRYTEFLLIILRDIILLQQQQQQKGKGKQQCLKLILMSATLQVQTLIDYFSCLPSLSTFLGNTTASDNNIRLPKPAHVSLQGRLFPVQEFFLETVLEITGYVNHVTSCSVDSDPTATSAVVANDTQQPQVMQDDELEKELEKYFLNTQGKIPEKESLECTLCQQSGFSNTIELGEHVALCNGRPTNTTKQQQQRQPPAPHDDEDKDDCGVVTNTTKDHSILITTNMDSSSKMDDTNYTEKEGEESNVIEVAASSNNDDGMFAEYEDYDVVDDSDDDDDGDNDDDKVTTIILRDNYQDEEEEEEKEEGKWDGISPFDVNKNIKKDGQHQTEEEQKLANSLRAEDLLNRYQTMHDDELIDNYLIVEILRYIIKSSYGDGAVLIFLPGWQEISELQLLLESTDPFYSNGSKYVILPLHSGIPSKDQRKVLVTPPKGVRKIILSTNIAETSLTINDVAFVIDTGRGKEKNYDPHLKTSTLKATWISQASCKQRTGRAGRTKLGVCFHLFSSRRHSSMNKYTESELLRTPLEEMCLMCKKLGLAPGGPEDKDGIPAFLSKALDAPHAKSVTNALELLVDLGAMQPETNHLTNLGECLSVLTMEPRVGKMVIWSYLLGCARVACNMAVAMSYKSPFVLPPIKMRKSADEAKVYLSKKSESDQVTIHHALESRDEMLKRSEGGGAPRMYYDFCRKNYLGVNTMQMISDLRRNLTRELTLLGFSSPVSRGKGSYHNRHDNDHALWQAALAAGLYPNVAFRKRGDVNFVTMTNQKVKVHLSSVNAVSGQPLKSKCQVPVGEVEFVCFGEMVKGIHSYTVDQTTHLASPLPLLLLCGTSLSVRPAAQLLDLEELQKQQDSESAAAKTDGMMDPNTAAILNLDDWIVFKCDNETASRIVILRKRLQSSFWNVISNPSAGLTNLTDSERHAIESLGPVLQSAHRSFAQKVR